MHVGAPWRSPVVESGLLVRLRRSRAFERQHGRGAFQSLGARGFFWRGASAQAFRACKLALLEHAAQARGAGVGSDHPAVQAFRAQRDFTLYYIGLDGIVSLQTRGRG